jgi:hypothetical protein
MQTFLCQVAVSEAIRRSAKADQDAESPAFPAAKPRAEPEGRLSSLKATKG